MIRLLLSILIHNLPHGEHHLCRYSYLFVVGTGFALLCVAIFSCPLYPVGQSVCIVTRPPSLLSRTIDILLQKQSLGDRLFD